MRISIVMATYNRSSILSETLQAITELDFTSLEAEIIIVDNNSSDETQQVVKRFQKILPIIYLFEPKPGKNCALNKALREIPMRDVIVFTDDDVTPNRDWLQKIWASCQHYPDYQIFGGKILLKWPLRDEWPLTEKVKAICYAHHDLGNNARPYQKDEHPFGPNFWIRKSALNNGRLYNETIGPRPKNRITGSESSFLVGLTNDGYEIMYCPDAIVHHRVEAKETTIAALIKRGYRTGRGCAYFVGIINCNLLKKSPLIWFWRQRAKLCYDALQLLISFIHPHKAARINRKFSIMSNIGWIIESMRLAKESQSLAHK